MMKKNGFTLAEVLITLAIIGVVATLTLPALMTNTGEQQYVTGLKKGINTLTEAAQMNEVILGFNYATLSDESDVTKDGEQSLFGLLANRANVDFTKTDNGTKHNAKMHTRSDNYTVFFRDGAALIFPKNATSTTTNGKQKNDKIMDDGLVYGIPVIYDVNGLKAPNTLSNCGANPKSALLSTSNVDDEGEADVCNNKVNRVIRDQFGVRLRGSFAIPNGAAAKWAFGQ